MAGGRKSGFWRRARNATSTLLLMLATACIAASPAQPGADTGGEPWSDAATDAGVGTDLPVADAARPRDATAVRDAQLADRESLPDASGDADVDPPPPFTLRLVVYNMHWAGDSDYSALAQELRTRATAGHEPDLALLQECFLNEGSEADPFPTFRTELADLYPHQWHGPLAGTRQVGSGVVILSQWPFADQRNGVYSTGLPPDSFASKGLAWVALDVGPGCPHLGVADTHLQAGKQSDFGGLIDPAQIRLEQTHEMIAQLDRYQGGNDLPLLLGGDFNYKPVEAEPTGYNGLYVLSQAWNRWLTNVELWCALNPTLCAASGEPLASDLSGVMKLFVGSTPAATLAPVALHKYAATDYGGLGDHFVLEVDYLVTCR